MCQRAPLRELGRALNTRACPAEGHLGRHETSNLRAHGSVAAMPWVSAHKLAPSRQPPLLQSAPVVHAAPFSSFATQTPGAEQAEVESQTLAVSIIRTHRVLCSLLAKHAATVTGDSFRLSAANAFLPDVGRVSHGTDEIGVCVLANRGRYLQTFGNDGQCVISFIKPP